MDRAATGKVAPRNHALESPAGLVCLALALALLTLAGRILTIW